MNLNDVKFSMYYEVLHPFATFKHREIPNVMGNTCFERNWMVDQAYQVGSIVKGERLRNHRVKEGTKASVPLIDSHWVRPLPHQVFF